MRSRLIVSSILVNLRPLGIKKLGRGFNKRDLRTVRNIIYVILKETRA